MFGRLGLGRFGTRFRVRVSVIGLVLGLIILGTLSRYYCAKRLFSFRSSKQLFCEKIVGSEKSLLAQ